MHLNEPTFTYREFLDYSKQLTDAGQTSGPDQSSHLVEYTALNHTRMERIEKRATLSEALKTTIDNLEQPQHWLLLTETWCGDSAQNLPVIGKTAEYAGDKIQLTIVLRDQNTHLVERYIPEVGMGIPRLLVLDAQDQLLGQWGARPQPAQAFIDKWKADPDNVDKKEVQKEMQLWYAKNKHQALQEELVALMEKAKKAKLA